MPCICLRLVLFLCIGLLATSSKISKQLHDAARGNYAFNLTENAALEAKGPGHEHWVDSKHLEGWYTKLDLCILANRSNDTVKTIMAQCEEEAEKRGEGDKVRQQPVRCRSGNSWPSKGEYCSSEDIPFSERKGLRRAIVGYDDPSQKPLKTFFNGLAQEKGALLMVGDSVMQQFFSAMACELEREGVWKDSSQFTNTDEMRYVEFPVQNSKDNDGKPVMYGVPVKFVPIYHFVNGRWDRVANAGMHHLKKNVEDLVAAHDSVTILINMGLHYVSNPIAHFTRSDYISQMAACLQYLNTVAEDGLKANKKIRVLWRETSAQHFPTSNGYWPGAKYASTMQLKCEPISDTSSSGDWRNSDVKTIIADNKLSHVGTVPFYNISLPLWSMHVNGHLRDCTHFCWSPMMYQSIFHYLAKPFKGKFKGFD